MFDVELVASFLTLVFLEIVLAGDNLVLIAILAGRLPESQRPAARRAGLILAVFTRLALLYTLFWISHIETPFTALGYTLTPRHIVFGFGGAFLIWKSIMEVGALLGDHHTAIDPGKVRSWNGIFLLTILQIALFDIIFSLDSVITAIGVAQHIEVMVAAIITATAVMFFLVNPISDFIERNPVVKLIALNFLFLVGVLLLVQAIGIHVDHLYFYLALGLAVLVQLVSLLLPHMLRGPVVSLTLVAVAVLLTSLVTDLSPYLGKAGHDAVHGLAQGGAAAFDSAAGWLRNALTAH